MRGPSDDEVEVTKSFIVKAFVSFNLHAWGAQMQLKGSGADDQQSKPAGLSCGIPARLLCCKPCILLSTNKMAWFAA
jgi:hypothetical protein